MKAINQALLLSKLNQQIPTVEASAFISCHGSILNSVLNQSINEDHFPALNSAMNIYGISTAQTLRQDKCEQITVVCAKGYVVTTRISQNILLTVIANPVNKLHFLTLLQNFLAQHGMHASVTALAA